MSLKSCTDTLKSINPTGISSFMPQAVDMIKNLKLSQGNIPMINAVGVQQLLGTIQGLQNLFANSSKPKNPTEQATLDAQNKLVQTLQSMS